MEGLKVVKNPDFDLKKIQALGPGLGSIFLNIKKNKQPREHYKQFDGDAFDLGLFDADEELIAKVTCVIKNLYEQKKGEVKALIITDIRTIQSRKALLGWSEHLLPEIMKIREEMAIDYAVFYLSRMEKGFFDYFIRPRRSKSDQVRFSQIRKVSVELVQGRTLFSDDPLKYLEIRKATLEDIPKIKGFIKQASGKMPLSRSLKKHNLENEMESLEGFNFENLALGLSAEGAVVGLLGLYYLSHDANTEFIHKNIFDPTFEPHQTYLWLGSWLTDLRPVLIRKSQKVGVFTHMYFNNSDIFYSMVCWWFKQTKKDKPVFLYPYYDGDLKALPSDSFHVNGFRGDLYLIEKYDDETSDILKPVLFSEPFDIDLPLLI